PAEPDGAPSDTASEGSGTAAPPAAGGAEDGPWAPRRLVRTCLASMVERRAFGPPRAGAAPARACYAAPRRAFVADGRAYGWSIPQGDFPDCVPIVDFLPVICYRSTAAQGRGPDEPSRGALYTAWVRACWQGRVSEVIAALAVHPEAVGRRPPGEEL